jgi:acyl-CoA thioesterase-2
MGDFEVDTRVEGEKGRYRAEVSKEWEVWGPNGGYVAAIALRAAGAEAGIDRPATFSGHFLGRAEFAEVQLEVEKVHGGRRSESLQVVMRQGERPIMNAIVRTAAEGPGLAHDVAKMPEVPGPEGLMTYPEIFPDGPGPPYPFWDNIEGRPLDAEAVREEPRRPREPIFREWYRFRPRATFEDVWVDAGRMLLLIDTLSWPAAAQPHPDSEYQAPNLDVTAWFHRFEPESEWLLADHEGQVAEGGLMGTTARIWSRGGRLLATGGAQLMCIPARFP